MATERAMRAEWLVGNDVEARAALWRILVAVDGEFVPPLSTRTSTTTRALALASGTAAKSEPHAYYEEMLRQENVMVRVDGAWAGFMSVRPQHEDVAIAAWCPCNYISTIGVLPAFRRAGVARRLYRAVIDEMSARSRAEWLVTRTWSTNDAHVALLGKLGFAEILRLANHRGEGLDSIYFARPVQRIEQEGENSRSSSIE